jgi:hypothetical protein
MLKNYFQSGIYPLRFLVGYGTNTVYKTDLVAFKAGFEFPVVMSALDHGILFALLVYLGIYLYVSYQILKRKKVQCWIGCSLVFAQMNTFNGLGLSNQDTFTWLCLFMMVLTNCALFVEEKEGEDKVQETEKVSLLES